MVNLRRDRDSDSSLAIPLRNFIPILIQIILIPFAFSAHTDPIGSLRGWTGKMRRPGCWAWLFRFFIFFAAFEKKWQQEENSQF